jgi:hypothetical protein
LNSGGTYRPETATLYNGTAGGEAFNVRLRNITILAAISVPEPMSFCHWAVSLLAVLGTVAKRWPRCTF